MKVLILGGAGFVGSHLCYSELEAGNAVVCYDNSDGEKIHELRNNLSFRFVRGDVMDFARVNHLIKSADLVYHLAAIADPAMYCKDPAKVLNVDMEATQNVVKACYMAGTKLVFASTSEIFGKNPDKPWDEMADRVLGPTNTSRWSYATSKAMGEHYCYAYGKYGLKFTIVRFFNFYGPRLDSLGAGRVMTCFLDRFMKGLPVMVCEPGTQTRCFTYIDDGIAGLLIAARNNDNTSFNLGSKEEISILDLAHKMKKIGNFTSKIELVQPKDLYGEGYDDIPVRVPYCGKARIVLGWTPTTSLDEGLRRTIEHYAN